MIKDRGELERCEYMDEGDLAHQGYVLEANRQFFHPLGLELATEIAEAGPRLRVFDRRALLAGGVFEPEDHEFYARIRRRKVAGIASEWELRAQARLDRYGFVVQPPEKLWSTAVGHNIEGQPGIVGW